MNPTDYDFVSTFLRQTSGLTLGTGKEYLVEARLIPLVRGLGLADFDQLLRELRKGSNKQISTAVMEAMTTNETSFFRDKVPFEDLKKTIIPALIKARSGVKKLRIWCAAASTGQEPYSLLMLLQESFPELLQWTVEVVATDIAHTILDRAREAIYSQFEVQRGLPIQYLVKYFDQVPQGWQVKQALRSKINWRQLNLLERFDNLGSFDVVLCRNVLIYVEIPQKTAVLNRVARLIRPDGYLLMGAAETVLGICNAFERYRPCASAVYALANSAVTSAAPVPVAAAS